MAGKLASLGKRVLGLIGRNAASSVVDFDNPPRPEIPVAIIGDIHGRADLLDRLLVKLGALDQKYHLVFVGDYVDRGPDSHAVLQRLSSLISGATCLRGNHETMMQEFIDDPIEKGGRWLRNGGHATLASFGVSLGDSPNVSELQNAAAELALALGGDVASLLGSMPIMWRSGNLVVTHAGPNPAQIIEGQPDKNFLWGHNRFLRDSRTDGVWVAHGHWIRDKAVAEAGRIGVDTGAWESGRLTAALVSPEGTVQFVST